MSLNCSAAHSLGLDNWMIAEPFHVSAELGRSSSELHNIFNILVHASVPEVEKLEEGRTVDIKHSDLIGTE